MRICFDDRVELVEYVDDLLMTSKLDSQLTMTIRREALGAFSVDTVTSGSSDDIEKGSKEWNFYSPHLTT